MRDASFRLIEEMLERAIEKRYEQLRDEADLAAEWEGTRIAGVSTANVRRALEELRDDRDRCPQPVGQA